MRFLKILRLALVSWLLFIGTGIYAISCSDLISAKILSSKLNQRVIATDGAVRVYPDGGVLGIGSNGQVTPWVECLPGNQVNTSFAQPRAPGNKSLSYVPLGYDL